MSDVVVESMASGDTMHVAHSSAQMGCFLVFAVVCALSAMAETAHARLHGRNGSGKREDDLGDLPLTATGASRGPGDSSLGISKRDEESGERAAAPPSTDESVGKSSAPVVESHGPLFDARRLAQLAPVRIALGDKNALIASRGTLRAWAEFGLVLALFYFADRTGAIPDSEKSYDRDLFLALFAALAAYGWRTSLHKSKTHAPLNREQTDM